MLYKKTNKRKILLRFFIFACFSCSCFCIKFGRLTEREAEISYLFVFALRLLVLCLSAYTYVRVCIVCACVSSRAALSKTLLLHIVSEKRRKSGFFCSISGFLALNLIVYHLKHLNSLCAYTNKHGKISLLSLYLWLTIKLLKTEKTKPCGSSFPSCLSSCLLSEYLRKKKARCEWRRSKKKEAKPLLYSRKSRKAQINAHQAIIFWKIHKLSQNKK